MSRTPRVSDEFPTTVSSDSYICATTELALQPSEQSTMTNERADSDFLVIACLSEFRLLAKFRE